MSEWWSSPVHIGKSSGSIRERKV